MLTLCLFSGFVVGFLLAFEIPRWPAHLYQVFVATLSFVGMGAGVLAIVRDHSLFDDLAAMVVSTALFFIFFVMLADLVLQTKKAQSRKR